MTQAGWEQPPRNSNKAIASLVCGILFMCAPASIAAVILGHLALADIKRTAGRMTGQGMAIAGLVMGYLGVALTTIYIIFVVFMVRNTLSHNVTVNEATALTTMRTYSQALKAYAEKCPKQGYPATLSPLGPGTGDCKRANLVELQLAAAVPVRQGYMFQYTAGVNGADRVTTFALVARPLQPGMTGSRFFYVDEEGVIRVAPSQIIGPNIPPLVWSGPQEKSGKATGSLVCGIIFFLWPVTALAAVILGHLALSEIKKSAGRLAGQGMAIAGLVLGYIGIAAVPFILIIAAIAIPNVLRARMAANEASAVGSLRTINTAAVTYASTYPRSGYPASLKNLGTSCAATSASADLIDNVLASGTKSGSTFVFTGAGNIPSPGYSIRATPISIVASGQRGFF